MKYHAIFGSALLACASLFNTGALAAEEGCGPLVPAASVKLTNVNNQVFVPVEINGAPKTLLLGTGGYMSQLTRTIVDELKIPTRDSAMQLVDVSGNISRKYIIADTLKLGSLIAQNQAMMVSPTNWFNADGVLSTDLLLRYDVEMDFPGGKLNYFLPDHCKGNVLYWYPDAVAAVPITIVDKSRLMVPVRLDGQKFNAMIDTGATRSVITTRTAKRAFDLGPDSPGMVPAGNMNGDPKLPRYTHTFKTLSFEGVTITNPTVAIIPDRMASADHTQQTGNRALTNGEFYKLPELALGRDVMRNLRIYMAFKERMLYVALMSKSDVLTKLDAGLAATPNNPDLLNYRCFERGLVRVNLDGALADCELSLKLRPGNSYVIDSKGFILYQLGRYQEAVAVFDEALKISPRKATSLFIRGLAKQKLGDAAGGSADVAAAKAIKADIKSDFDGAGIAEN